MRGSFGSAFSISFIFVSFSSLCFFLSFVRLFLHALCLFRSFAFYLLELRKYALKMKKKTVPTSFTKNLIKNIDFSKLFASQLITNSINIFFKH